MNPASPLQVLSDIRGGAHPLGVIHALLEVADHRSAVEGVSTCATAIVASSIAGSTI